MTVKPWAGFIADFPDDQVGDSRGIEVFGGRNVAVAIGEILTGLGCKVSAPDYAEEKGWEFDFQDEEQRRFWCQVTSFHPAFWLLFEDAAITGGTQKKNAAAYAEMWRKLAAALDRDPRFHDTVWRSMDDGPPEPEEIGSESKRRAASDIQPVPLDGEFLPQARQSRQTRWSWGNVVLGVFGLFVLVGPLIGFIVDLNAGRPSFRSYPSENLAIGVIATIWAGLRARRRS